MIYRMKRELRIAMRQATAKLARAELERQAGLVFDRIEKLEVFRNARTIAFFWSLWDEIPTHETVNKWSDTKKILLPRVGGPQMDFVEYTSDCKMAVSELRILTPLDTCVADPDSIDIIIVPGVSFDKELNRLGRGKGYYDMFLNQISGSKITSIGICLEHQLIQKVPALEHDRKVDILVCGGRVYGIEDDNLPADLTDEITREGVMQ